MKKKRKENERKLKKKWNERKMNGKNINEKEKHMRKMKREIKWKK